MLVRRSGTDLRPLLLHAEINDTSTERGGEPDIRHPVATSFGLQLLWAPTRRTSTLAAYPFWD